LLILTAACASPTQPVEQPNVRNASVVAPADGDGTWAYIQFPNDRDYDVVEPLEGSGPNPVDVPFEPSPPSEPKNVKVIKCRSDKNCPSGKVCLAPMGGSQPHGVCGRAVDRFGRQSPNRIVMTCRRDAACPGSATCVMAYTTFGVCFSQ
jgi:hypothetical protein